SFGGRIGIVLATQFPKKLQKLVLVDAAGIRTPIRRRSLIRFLAKLMKPMFALPYMDTVRTRLYHALGAEDYLATPELQETFKLVIEEDLRPLLPDVSQETLLVWGANDTDTPLSFAHTMEEAIPHSRLTVLAGAGHFSFLDAPEAFNRLLIEFLA